MGDEIQEFFKFALSVTREAGERVKTDFYANKKIAVKENFADLVTETDHAVEEMLMSRLGQKFPEHKFIGEETVSAGGHCILKDDPTWIIDPVDGTTNFVHGILHTCISVGLAINKEVVAGIVHCPILGETYTAVRGQGAYCNDEKLSPSTVQDLNESVIILEGGTSRIPKVLQTKMHNMKSVIENCRGIRAYGSAAYDMCQIARGCGEAYMEHGIHVWDIAAGKVIVEEAGGVVTDPSGGCLDLFNRRVLAACNSSLAQQMSKILTNIDLEKD